MALGESSKHVIGHSSSTSSGETAMHASTLIISLVKEAAAIAPCVELKQAAAVALVIFETIQVYKQFNPLVAPMIQLFIGSQG